MATDILDELAKEPAASKRNWYQRLSDGDRAKVDRIMEARKNNDPKVAHLSDRRLSKLIVQKLNLDISPFTVREWIGGY